MKFWKKYNIYFRMALVVILYFLATYTSLFIKLLAPLRSVLGVSVYGCQTMGIFVNVIIYAALFIFTLFLLPDLYYVDFKISKKIKFDKLMAFVGIGYGGLLVGNLIGGILTMSFGGGNDSVNETTINTMLKADTAWIYIPIVCIVGPIVEEIVYRGILQSVIIGNKFQKLSNPRVFVGIIGSALLFGLIHVFDAGDYIQIFPYFFMGLSLGSITYASKSMYPSMIIHIINNTISVLATFAATGLLFR